jgi:hypothetical protein
MCNEPLPPGVYPFAVDNYISYHISLPLCAFMACPKANFTCTFHCVVDTQTIAESAFKETFETLTQCVAGSFGLRRKLLTVDTITARWQDFLIVISVVIVPASLGVWLALKRQAC